MLDRYAGCLFVLRNCRDREVSGAKRFAQGGVQSRLHAEQGIREIPKRIQKGPILIADV